MPLFGCEFTNQANCFITLLAGGAAISRGLAAVSFDMDTAVSALLVVPGKNNYLSMRVLALIRLSVPWRYEVGSRRALNQISLLLAPLPPSLSLFVITHFSNESVQVSNLLLLFLLSLFGEPESKRNGSSLHPCRCLSAKPSQSGFAERSRERGEIIIMANAANSHLSLSGFLPRA